MASLSRVSELQTYEKEAFPSGLPDSACEPCGRIDGKHLK